MSVSERFTYSVIFGDFRLHSVVIRTLIGTVKRMDEWGVTDVVCLLLSFSPVSR